MKIVILVLRLCLLPVSLLYGIILEIRNFLYWSGIFKQYKEIVPVISIGNISAGGSGKTPLTIYIAQILLNLGLKIAVVSRGYGRRSKGFVLVSDGSGKDIVSCDKGGDEPVLIARNLPGVIVAVAEKRQEAIERILATRKNIQVVLLDDAFQHRAITRDLDVLLMNHQQRPWQNLPMPSGNLREFYHNIRRANVIVETNVMSFNSSPVPARFQCRFEGNDWLDVDFNIIPSMNDLKGKRCVAFAGIANPENFKVSIKNHHLDVVKFLPFRDHHRFTLQDIQFLADLTDEMRCDFLLCTEKDFVKISDNPELKKTLTVMTAQFAVLRQTTRINNENEFLKILISVLDST